MIFYRFIRLPTLYFQKITQGITTIVLVSHVPKMIQFMELIHIQFVYNVSSSLIIKLKENERIMPNP